MKQPALLGVSIALNLALAAALLWSRPVPASVPKGIAPPPIASRTNIEFVAAPKSSTSTGATFQWSQLMSDDLKVYRDRLLAFGCPRATVRDIIMGEINERFGPRRQALIAELQSRFWDLVLRGGEQAVRAEAVTPFLALKAEREQLIHDVLGVGFGSAEAAAQLNYENFQSTWSWLPKEKFDQLYALEQKRQQALSEWLKAAGDLSDRQLTAEENQRLEAITQEFEDARNGLLTPEEQEESKLRQSTASLWASDTSYFEPSEAEWKSVARLLRDTVDAKLHLIYTDLSYEDREKESAKLDDAYTESLKQALGAERYAEFVRTHDAQFLSLYYVTQRYGLEKSVANEAYDLQQSAVAQADKLRNDASLAPEDRQKALALLQNDTEQALTKTLGDSVLATYKEYDGDWLSQLSRSGSQ